MVPEFDLFIGDIDDASDVETLKRLGIAAVVNMCAECLWQQRYACLWLKLSRAHISLLLMKAEDGWDFNIFLVVQRAQGFISSVLAQNNGRVLVCCYGNMNRSGAVCAIYLTKEWGMPLTAAIEQLRKVRGAALTNLAFLKQVV